METTKLSQEEIDSIANLKQEFNELINTIGLIEYEILDLTEKRKIIGERLLAVRNQEQEIYRQLVDKYGEGTLSLDTGEFVKD